MKRLMPGLSLQALSELILLLLALVAFVSGLGVVVRGAAFSAFFPAALPAVLLGWFFSRTRLKSLPALLCLFLVGLLLLWSATAQIGPIFLTLIGLVGKILWQNYLRLHGLLYYLDPNLSLELQLAFRELLAQSTALWLRTGSWLIALQTGTNGNDPVVRVLAWSLLAWVLSMWAGWYVGRGKVLAGLVPVLLLLAFVTKYTNASVTSLWVMAGCILGLISLSRFDANFRRWVDIRLDYADLAVSQTLLTGVVLTISLVVLGWLLPQISLRDMLESFRRRDVSENQVAHSLGLEAAPQPVRSVATALQLVRPAGLPNDHLLGSGPELSKDLVFTVSTAELPARPQNGPYVAEQEAQISAPHHYWRSLSYDIYTGSGWYSSATIDVNAPAGQALFEIPSGYQMVKQAFDLKHGKEGSLYFTGNLYRSNQTFNAAWRIPPGQDYPQAVDPFRGADLYGALNSAAVYQVESLIPIISEEQLRSAGRDTPDFIQRRYTQLPSRVPERVYALARNLTATAVTPYDEALALENYLRNNFRYTLDVSAPPHGVDVADYFLFELKRGYCDYYATAMVVMARSVGLPARLVTGYDSGTYDPVKALYFVTAADAHAWVEVYFPGTGWVEFEPTAGRSAIIRPQKPEVPAVSDSVALGDRFVRTVYSLPSVARWGLAALTGVLGLVMLCFILESWFLSLITPKIALRWMYRGLYRQAKPLGAAPVPGVTASEFAMNLQPYFSQADERLSFLTGLYMRVLFSTQAVKPTELRRAVSAWRVLRWKLFWMRKRK